MLTTTLHFGICPSCIAIGVLVAPTGIGEALFLSPKTFTPSSSRFHM
jgi:hypothetical protein